MRARNSMCSWRSVVSVSAVGLMAISAISFGEPRTRKADVNNFAERVTAAKVLPPRQGPVEVPDVVRDMPGTEIEVDPQGVPIVLYEVMDDATYERGGSVAAGGPLSAVVYEQRADAGVGLFGVLVSTEVGNWHGSWSQLANWVPGSYITGYDVLISHSSADLFPATVRMSLWDSDPEAFADTSCTVGGVPAMIPGSDVTFSQIPLGIGIPPAGAIPWVIEGDGTTTIPPGAFMQGLFRLKATLPAKVQVNCPNVWLVQELLEGCRIGWRIASSTDAIDAQVGSGLGELFVFSNTQDPLNGLECCETGAACTVATSAAVCGHADFCTDGVVDALGGSFSNPGGMPPTFISNNSQILAAADQKMYGMPVSADARPESNPPQNGWTLSGNEIKMVKGDHPVWIDWFVTSWDPGELADGEHRVKGYQAWIDDASYTTAIEGVVTPYRPACVNNAACTTAIGPGSECAVFGSLGSVCAPALVKDRPDYIFRGSAQVGPAADISTPALRWGSALNQASASVWKCNGGVVAGKVCDPAVCPDPNAPCNDPGSPSLGCNGIPAIIPDGLCQPNQQDRYHGTSVLHVSADAKGTFTITLRPPSFTNLILDNNQFLPLLAIEPALLTVSTGQCCNLDSFTCISDQVTQNTCEDLGLSFNADKTCADDCGCTADEQCDDGNFCTDDICNLQTASCENPSNVAPGECCDPADNVRLPIDDNNECTDDSCDEATGVVTHAPVAEFTACGDSTDTECDNPDSCDAAGNCLDRAEPNTVPCNGGALSCFYNVCDGAGACDDANDIDINGYPCMTDADCIALGGDGGLSGTNATCVNGACDCVACFTNLPCGDPFACYAEVGFDVGGDDNCFADGEKLTIDISVGQALKPLGGGQFFIEYDPACLDFQGISAVAPYTTVLAQEVNEAAGTIFWAVGVGLNPNTGEPEPCSLGGQSFGTMSFAKVPNCNSCDLCYGGVNPRETLLAACGTKTPEGNESAVCPLTECSKPISSDEQITVDVPDNMKVNVDCDSRTAIVGWAAPAVGSTCGNAELCGCSGTNVGPKGTFDVSGACMTGGELPIGTNTFCATGCDGNCSEPVTECWTVEVNEETTLDVVVQLSPIIASNMMQRCIEFELYSDCVQPPFTFCEELLFGGPFDLLGHYTDSIKIPEAGQWVCITARDKQHTLRATAFLDCVDGVYEAVFKGDPFFGGNWLIGGNLDGWKKANPNAGHDVINILDFGQYIAQWGQTYGGSIQACDEDCHPDGANADINGDGIVDGLDFAFISLNFLEVSKDACCPGSIAGNTVPLTEVSVRELREMGLGDLAVADLNGDGVLNMDDMSAFMAGETPKDKDRDQSRKGSGLRSSR